MKDLLEDMPLQATENEQALSSKKGKSPTKKRRVKIKMRKQKSTPTMDKFFQKVETIKSDMVKLTAATSKVNELCEQAIHAKSTEEENVISERLQVVVFKANKLAKKTKDALCKLEQDSKTLVKKEKLDDSEHRIRDNLCTTLNRKFCEEIRLYQEAQQAYKVEMLGKVKRQVQIVKPEITDDELNTVMNNKGGRDALYKEMVLSGGVSSEVKATYDSVTGKYEEIQALQASVAELHQIFLDVALLTEQQGEILDHIEFQVKSSGEDVEEGIEQVKEAIHYQKKFLKKKWICRVIFIGIIVVVVIVVVL